MTRTSRLPRPAAPGGADLRCLLPALLSRARSRMRYRCNTQAMSAPQNRDGSGRFPKGSSGNPGGRPKGLARATSSRVALARPFGLPPGVAGLTRHEPLPGDPARCSAVVSNGARVFLFAEHGIRWVSRSAARTEETSRGDFELGADNLRRAPAVLSSAHEPRLKRFHRKSLLGDMRAGRSARGLVVGRSPRADA